MGLNPLKRQGLGGMGEGTTTGGKGKGWQALVKAACPISKGDVCHVSKDRDKVGKVALQASHSKGVI